MARSSRRDPVEKFRFKVTVFDFDPINFGRVSQVQDKSMKAGFHEVTLPKANISELNYRENIDPIRTKKGAGLATYEPVILRRGVMFGSTDLYSWYKKVNNDANALSVLNRLAANQNIMAIYPADYRRDVVIEVLDRTGKTARAWFLFDAFPVSYKGGNDLNAVDNELLLEEISLTYEAFVELPVADIRRLQGESEDAAKSAFASAALSFVLRGGF